MTKHVVWIMVLALACDRGGAKPPSGGAVASSGSATGSGSGSGDPATDQAIDHLIADTLTYMHQLPGVLLAFDGNCDTHADRLLKLEPLVTSIRSQSQELASRDPGAPDRMKQRLQTHKDAELAKIDEELKAMGATKADVERKDGEIKQKCGDNARVKDAMDRVGVFKKKKT